MDYIDYSNFLRELANPLPLKSLIEITKVDRAKAQLQTISNPG
jgi:hypothetical protein